MSYIPYLNPQSLLGPFFVYCCIKPAIRIFLMMAATTSPDYDDLVSDVSKQMAASQLTRRLSRSSGSQSGRRSARIEKPRSIHNSPRVLERRKTTTGVKRYATLDDHYNMMFGLTGGEEEAVEERKEAPRPLSWHPSSSQFHTPSHTVPEPLPTQGYADWVPYQSQSRNSGFESEYNTRFESEYNSLSNRSSAFADQMQDFPPFSHSTDTVALGRDSFVSGSSWQDIHQPVSYALSSYSSLRIEPTPWYLQSWAQMTQTQSEISRPTSTDFLPIQHPSAQQDAKSQSALEDDDSEEAGKELVGMGLYDPPEGFQSWQSGLLQSGGKGLKLEETWQPPEQDEDVDDASSDDGSVDEPPAGDDQQWSLNAGQQLPANMEGRSFFFDDDDMYTKEWWFQQLKQPTVQDARLGYDWL